MADPILRAVLNDAPYHELPKRSFWKVYGTDRIDPSRWGDFSKVPGSFVPTNKGPMPADGLWVDRLYLRTHQYPKMICVPIANAHDLRQRMDGTPSEWVPNEQDPGRLAAPDPPHGTYYLYPFQQQAATEFMDRHRMVVSLPIGTGKTLCAVAPAETLLREQVIDRCVIAAGKVQLREVWEDELEKFYGRAAPEVCVLEGTAEQRRRILARILSGEHQPKYLLTTYDAWRVKGRDLLGQLTGPRTMVVIDEAHHLKDPKTQRFRSIRKALTLGPGGPVEYRMAITGSLIADKVLDVFGPVDLVGLHVWNDWWEFRNEYFRWVERHGFDGRTYYEFDGFRSEADAKRLDATLDAVTFHRTPEQLDIEIPRYRRDQRRIRVSPIERRLYSQFYDAVRDDIAGARSYGETFALMTIQREFASDPAILLMSKSATASKIVSKLGRERIEALSPGPKFLSLCAWLGEFLSSSDGKVIVFSWLEMFQQFVREKFADPEFRRSVDLDGVSILDTSLFFNGGEGGADIARRFRTDPNYRILWSTDSGSEGLNYQEVAQYCVHYDDSLRLDIMEQREGRIYRRGQKKRTLFVSFETDVDEEKNEELSKMSGTYIDHRIRELLQWKARMKEQLGGR